MPIELVRINEAQQGYTVIFEDTDDVIRDEMVNVGTPEEKRVIDYQRFTAYVAAREDLNDVKKILEAAMDLEDDKKAKKGTVHDAIIAGIGNLKRKVKR